MTNPSQTPPVETLSEEALAEISTRPAYQYQLGTLVALTIAERDALCQSLRVAWANLATAEELKRGYYDEAAKGWDKFRAAEKENTAALREQLAQQRQTAFRDGRFALMGIHGSTSPDPTHRKGFVAGVNAAIQALEAAAKKEQP